ncbi:endonuclease/exonuclease/phosphatase family protein [Sphingobium sp. H39-3-25]|uniref:endonuclease/exonuclease/phosphatase family protein n=1 Tax=Sphingobium arseniciresistens TaxID=3030834 RepID=UPI0023B9A776|nr:endonuclease/exonuclease/phosphatase family protein [Sphingobium arseniciresistens]
MFRPFHMLLFAGLAALAASGSSTSKARLVLPAPGKAQSDDPQPLSVMTYNIKGLPWPIALGREEAMERIADRLAALRRAGRQPHVILLQEAFTPEAAQIAAQAGYAHVAAGPDAGLRTPIPATEGDTAYGEQALWYRGEGVDKQLGSGLMILSDYPIIGIDRMAFPDFACAGFDCLANKGVLIAHLKVPGIDAPVSIVNTHLNARKAAGVPIGRSLQAFSRQVELMARFIRRHVPADRAMILGGDMNIGGDRDRYAAFFTRFAQTGMGFVTPAGGGARIALAQTAAGDTEALRDLAASCDRRKDWLFARDVGNVPMRVVQADVPFGREPQGEPLSDHFGYAIRYAPGGAPTMRLASARRPAVMTGNGA